MYTRCKRIFDIFVSLILLIVASPLFILAALLLLFSLGWPCVFTQTRLGWKGAPFKVYKFRTMTSDCDDQGELLPDHLRLPRMGKLVRSLSLDELPQLFNVLKGDMSLVGPRPLLVSYKDLYTQEQFRRHDCKPGITGWAQVNGRNSISWAERFKLDLYYVNHRNFILDMKILYLTAEVVFFRRGVSSGDSVTMEAFNGLN